MVAEPVTTDLSDFWQHDISVERYEGSGAFGDVFAAATEETGFVDDTRKLVRDVAGQEVISSARVFLPPTIADVPPDSRVTLPAQFADRISRVIAVARHDSGTLGLPDHLEIALQ